MSSSAAAAAFVASFLRSLPVLRRQVVLNRGHGPTHRLKTTARACRGQFATVPARRLGAFTPPPLASALLGLWLLCAQRTKSAKATR
jgi:hypothetical protein